MESPVALGHVGASTRPPEQTHLEHGPALKVEVRRALLLPGDGDRLGLGRCPAHDRGLAGDHHRSLFGGLVDCFVLVMTRRGGGRTNSEF